MPYEGYKVYGPYVRASGRKFIVLYKSEKDKQTLGYSRYLMALSIGRELKEHEDVHHINGDFTDDKLENLELVLGFLHDSHHAVIRTPKKPAEEFVCNHCNKTFKLENPRLNAAKQFRKNHPDAAGPFCSRACAAKDREKNKLGAIKQRLWAGENK